MYCHSYILKLTLWEALYKSSEEYGGNYEVIRARKLIDIMKRYGDKNTDSFPFEGVADKLLANGVIVPPCIFGDTLYIVRGDTLKILEGVVTAIIQRRKFMYAEVFIEENRKTLFVLTILVKRYLTT